MGAGKKSYKRTHARETEAKFKPAIKQLSEYVYNTAKDAPEDIHHGYEIPCGNLTAPNGKNWQFQLRAVCIKSKYIKENELKPIINKWAIMFKVRLFVKTFIDKLFE